MRRQRRSQSEPVAHGSAGGSKRPVVDAELLGTMPLWRFRFLVGCCFRQIVGTSPLRSVYPFSG